ncbi:1046_t:CDS:2 [Paraglomus occultum]|uniref:1046_t:CDS:1 n=1 Tax=Paraglomus occultum TaxID=144539 RepID=A0A9N9D1D2_9GLOM|nr:1046_t:CDS:2 [Paraglomus occultum]
MGDDIKEKRRFQYRVDMKHETVKQLPYLRQATSFSKLLTTKQTTLSQTLAALTEIQNQEYGNANISTTEPKINAIQHSTRLYKHSKLYPSSTSLNNLLTTENAQSTNPQSGDVGNSLSVLRDGVPDDFEYYAAGLNSFQKVKDMLSSAEGGWVYNPKASLQTMRVELCRTIWTFAESEEE